MKDGSINYIVKYLQDKWGDENVSIVDYWDADQCAIGLTNKINNKLVYISTYLKKKDEYYIALESLSTIENLTYGDNGFFDNINIADLEKIAKEHLELK
jgi:hypothetical protein